MEQSNRKDKFEAQLTIHGNRNNHMEILLYRFQKLTNGCHYVYAIEQSSSNMYIILYKTYKNTG